MSLQDYSQQDDQNKPPSRKSAVPAALQSFEERVLVYSGIVRRVSSHASFWKVVPLVTLLAGIYFYMIADPLYVSESVISIQHKAPLSAGLGSMLGNLTGSSGSSNEDATLAAYIVSNDMLAILDKQFHLRQVYTNEPSNPFARLGADASQERFLKFYRSMVELDVRYDVGLLTIRVLDYQPQRAQQINLAILANAEKFMNQQSLAMMNSSLGFARNELQEAQQAAARAGPRDQDVARMRMQSAQEAFASASSLAGQQQTFLTRISSPNMPSSATRPEKLLDTLAAAVIASVLYAIAILGLANIRDHRAA